MFADAVPADPAALRRTIPGDAVVDRWTAPDGWPIRRFDRAGSGRGAILFLTGRGDVFEKYLELFAHWHDCGWTVTAFDWRGQGGSGRLGADERVGHASDFAPWIADLAAFRADWTARHVGGPHVVVGHSMGGFLALRALTEGAIAADAAVLVAPMLGLRSPVGARAGGWLARAMRRLGDPARAAWRDGNRPGERGARQRNLTAAADRYADEAWWYERAPALKLGPPSWGWLAEAFAATRRLRHDARLEEMRTPTLMLVAGHDALVDAGAATAVAGRLPDAELIRFGAESAHEILREADPVRTRAIAAIDRFLDRRAPAR